MTIEEALKDLCKRWKSRKPRDFADSTASVYRACAIELEWILARFIVHRDEAIAQMKNARQGEFELAWQHGLSKSSSEDPMAYLARKLKEHDEQHPIRES